MEGVIKTFRVLSRAARGKENPFLSYTSTFYHHLEVFCSWGQRRAWVSE